MNNYRPWGTLDWLLSKTDDITWDLIGCVGTEDRSLEVYRRLAANLSSSKLLKIRDEDFKYSQGTRDILENRLQQIIDIAGVSEPDNVEDHNLLESHDEILSPVEDYISGKQDIILDVSSMPKRFFFPILKTLFKSDDIRNLLVTYTVPQSYTEGKLSKNPTEWTHLPLFSGDNNDAGMLLVIGVGFDPMGIPQVLSPEGDAFQIKFMFPFPAPLSSVKRAWEFVRNIEKRRSREGGNLELFRVEAKNPSDTFDRLCALSTRGQKKIELAPFGPKAVSVAMCLYATLTESKAFYTQPKTYAPNYSTGVSEVFAYAIKLDGRNFYCL